MSPHATRPCWECSHCGSVVCPEPVADGVRESGGRGRDCPVCHAALTRAVLDDRAPIEVCDHCKGILTPLHTFAETVTARRRSARTPSVTPPPADRGEFGRRIRCPKCSEPMITDWYCGPGNIIIDTCETCSLVWLDAGELRRAVDAPGSDRRP